MPQPRISARWSLSAAISHCARANGSFGQDVSLRSPDVERDRSGLEEAERVFLEIWARARAAAGRGTPA